ncbi:MAG: DUF4832 domain-containing protein [Pseudobacter sp.]|uniref:DUF4832 domain-containing protein n=1 Tax=Pseudobacter sp. TaxID=2045420 RepID=UPI003F814FBA
MTIFKNKKGLVFGALSLLAISCKKLGPEKFDQADIQPSVEVANGMVTVRPAEYNGAIRNPMKGFREFIGPGIDPKRAEYPYPYGTLVKEYMQWNMLEDNAGDGVDKIIAYSNHRWAGVEDDNIKVIPRIYIVWMEPWHGGVAKGVYTNHPDDLNGWHWPSDLPGQTRPTDPTQPITGGYFHPTFQDRVKALVAKAGEAWDNDPRVAYVEMGIIGEWGEQHDPNISTYWLPHDEPAHVANRTWIPGMEKTLGDAFTSAFKNKKVMVRYAYEFKDYDFGIYWDSWSQPEEQVRGYDEMKKLGNRWKTQPIGGEITWNWGGLSKFNSFEAVVADGPTRATVIEQIRNLHNNHLGGITWADFNNSQFKANAEELQRAMGYNFVISDFTYPTKIEKNKPFKVGFKVVNNGSSPFYYNWPVEISLLNKRTKKKVWGKVLENVNISEWMPGDNWDKASNRYTIAPEVYSIEKEISLDVDLSEQEYVIAISVLDPAGNMPSLRFAVQNYFIGGRHPMGYIGINKELENYEIPSMDFRDMKDERTLKYQKQ